MKVRNTVLAIAAGLLLSVAPAGAVFPEKNLKQTLSVLQYELSNSYNQISMMSQRASQREEEQQRVLVQLMQNCNELSIMLYSQQQDFTFDLTYALNEVTKQYEHFDANRMPYNRIVESMRIELNRYDKLAQTLRNIPPIVTGDPREPQVEVVMDSLTVQTDTLLAPPSFIESQRMDAETAALRDSCLILAENLVELYWESIHRVEEDSRYYEETDLHLKEAYDYAQERYRLVQKKIFIDGQTPFLRILRSPGRYFTRSLRECQQKYSTSSFKSNIVSEWRGPVVIWLSAIVLIYIILAIILANIIVRLTMRWVPYFKTEYFRSHRFMLIVLAGIVIFAISIWVANLVVGRHNFFSMASTMLAEFAWLLAAIFTSLLIRLNSEQGRHVLAGYLPMMFMTLVIITFRIIFIPNSMVNVLLPPVLLVVSVWQLIVNYRRREMVPRTDRIYMWISLAVFIAATVVAWAGYVMMALLLAAWWSFQVALLQTVSASFAMLSRYYDKHLSKRLMNYRKRNPDMPLKAKGSFIEVSWAFDLVKRVIVPVISVWSLPLCIYWSGGIFDLSSVSMEYFYTPFINVENVINLSLFKLVMVISLYFVFNYLNYALKAFYRVYKTRQAIKKLEEGVVFRESDINFNLAENIITLLVWGIFAITAFVMLKIPTSALTIITTGLAAGIGFALKDVLNNFFYGVQLMSGRLRVGDVIECDGIRGTVESLSYQSTQIQSSDGSVIAFSNSNLFGKNFKNLTRSNHYELLKIAVGVKYGTDVDKVRELIIEALKVLQVKDKYGRDIVDTKRGVTVRLEGFGDNSIDLMVIQYTTVDTHFTYAAQAREIIYNTLNENGIEIPFPQRDVHIVK